MFVLKVSRKENVFAVASSEARSDVDSQIMIYVYVNHSL